MSRLSETHSSLRLHAHVSKSCPFLPRISAWSYMYPVLVPPLFSTPAFKMLRVFLLLLFVFFEGFWSETWTLVCIRRSLSHTFFLLLPHSLLSSSWKEATPSLSSAPFAITPSLLLYVLKRLWKGPTFLLLSSYISLLMPVGCVYLFGG